MNLKAWEYYLHYESNAAIVYSLYDGVRTGFDIVDRCASVKTYACSNYRSVLVNDSYTFVNNLIVEELASGKYTSFRHSTLYPCPRSY